MLQCYIVKQIWLMLPGFDCITTRSVPVLTWRLGTQTRAIEMNLEAKMYLHTPKPIPTNRQCLEVSLM